MSSFTALILGALVVVVSCNVIPQNRIVGGSNAQAGQHLYAASLQTKEWGHFCGASIIDARWAITAASCLTNYCWGGPTDTLKVRTGTHTYNRGGVEHSVEIVRCHERYDYMSRSNDIALVRTTAPIALNAQTAFVQIGASIIGASQGVVSGWGHTKNQGQKSLMLQTLNTPIITNEDCRAMLAFNNFANIVQASNICALSAPGQGVCRADSGSPLVVNNELVGIVSFAVACATGVPDVYTRVASYNSWITTQKSQFP